jgi:hypothetical protein
MVEIRIAAHRLAERENEVLKGQLLLTELRDALVPVTGVLFPTGVIYGTLSTSTDLATGDTVLQWVED